ncbi:MAG: hypothetical protein LBJ63_00100 [Prevotellaceae bacterium]|jgi:hypothetical protein|nr:hypothetical protein [Prevotellaceae bacterium]
MENNLITQNPVFAEAESFIKMLSAEPDKTNVKINENANNAKYLPVSFVENQLDELFFGAWELRDFKYQVVANELAGSIQLRFFHPVFQTWIERTGCAAVQIQMKSLKNGGDGNIANVQNKITNTLTKDFPHLKAECVKNAARSIGKIFGRDLNRKFEDTYNPLSVQIEDQKIISEMDEKIEKCMNVDELEMLWDTLDDDFHGMEKIRKLFTIRKNELKYGKN